MPKVTIIHKQETGTHELRKGLGFQALAAQGSAPIEFDCRAADCGICIVRVIDGADHLSEPTTAERDFLKAMRADPDERLACQCRIMGDISVVIDSF